MDGIGKLLGDKRRRESIAIYACGLFGDGERKSVEPIAAWACGSPEEMEAMHSRLLHFVTRSDWENRPIREDVARYALHPMQMHGPVRHWTIDDTGFLKQGNLSFRLSAGAVGLEELDGRLARVAEALRALR